MTGTLLTIGSGSDNTDRIIAQNGAGTDYAAGLARAYNGGSYSDWYLPSVEELNKLFLNRGSIGGFVDYYYWTSSEKSFTNVYVKRFNPAGSSAETTKDQFYRVRAIRKF